MGCKDIGLMDCLEDIEAVRIEAVTVSPIPVSFKLVPNTLVVHILSGISMERMLAVDVIVSKVMLPCSESETD